MDSFVSFWRELKRVAQDRSAGFDGWKKKEAGMAAFKLSYNPYEAEWTCSVSWSDSKEVSGKGFDEEHAVEDCLNNLAALKKQQ